MFELFIIDSSHCISRFVRYLLALSVICLWLQKINIL
jgi:hypothetical protein